MLTTIVVVGESQNPKAIGIGTLLQTWMIIAHRNNIVFIYSRLLSFGYLDASNNFHGIEWRSVFPLFAWFIYVPASSTLRSRAFRTLHYCCCYLLFCMHFMIFRDKTMEKKWNKNWTGLAAAERKKRTGWLWMLSITTFQPSKNIMVFLSFLFIVICCSLVWIVDSLIPVV